MFKTLKLLILVYKKLLFIFILAQFRCPKHTRKRTHIDSGSLFTGLAKRGTGQGR